MQIAKDGVTNHDHNCGVQLMLIAMAAALPIRAASGQGSSSVCARRVSSTYTISSLLQEADDSHGADAHSAQGLHQEG